MKKRKNKPVSFDAMVKFFMQSYDIPTGNDVRKIMSELNHIEMMINALREQMETRDKYSAVFKKEKFTPYDKVLYIMKQFPDGVSITDIKARTGLEDKKIRNIIYRLYKQERIKRKSRGVYIGSK